MNIKITSTFILICFFISLFFPVSAVAEVMDKEMALGDIWLMSLKISIVGFLACLWIGWKPLVLLPFASGSLIMQVLECNDPFVGPAIRAEAGTTYVIQVYLSLILVIVASFSGVALWKLRKKKSQL